jgi:ribosomal protein L28
MQLTDPTDLRSTSVVVTAHTAAKLSSEQDSDHLRVKVSLRGLRTLETLGRISMML